MTGKRYLLDTNAIINLLRGNMSLAEKLTQRLGWYLYNQPNRIFGIFKTFRT